MPLLVRSGDIVSFLLSEAKAEGVSFAVRLPTYLRNGISGVLARGSTITVNTTLTEENRLALLC